MGIGRGGTTGVPNRQGFDYFFGYLNQRHAHNYYPTYLWRNEERIELRNLVPDEEPEGARRFDQPRRLRPRPVGRRGVGVHRSGTATGRFFLYLAFTIPHANNEANNNGMEVPDLGEFAERRLARAGKGQGRDDHADGSRHRPAAGMLKELGIDDNTLVFFTSDNGPHKEGGVDPKFFDSTGPLRGIKRDLYEGGIRVPMIARWPKRIKAGAKSDQVWALWDFLPTRPRSQASSRPPTLTAFRCSTRFAGGRQRDHEFLYWEFHERGFSQAVRMGDWKAVRKSPGLAARAL